MCINQTAFNVLVLYTQECVSLIDVLYTFVNVSEIGEFQCNIFKTFSAKKSNILINMRLSFNASE